MNTLTIIDARITEEDGSFVVTPVWSGVDRPDSASWSTGKNRALAGRLAQAMKAGVVFENPSIMTDVNGKTFVSALSLVRGRALNADLRRLGF